MVGSSTVFPFARTVAEHYAVKFQAPPPVIEVTGTGGGFQTFCKASGTIDIATASRQITRSERELCADNGIDTVLGVQIGFDGIVLAVSPDSPLRQVTLKQLYLALAKDLPTAGGFEANPHQTWSDVDPALPPLPIEVHGPPPTSGTRDAFMELALEGGAVSMPALIDLKRKQPAAFHLRAQSIREDGRWIDEGENDNAIVQLVRNSSFAVGILGYSFYDQNRSLIRGVSIGSAAPDFSAITKGDYPLARSLYFYIADRPQNEAVADYALEFTSESAVGPYGYVAAKGLIPLPEAKRLAQRRKILSLLDGSAS